MLSYLKKIEINVLLLAFAALLTKMLVISPSFPDAIIFMVMAGLYGFYLKIESLKPKVTKTDKLEEDIKELKNALSKGNVASITQPKKYF